MLRWLGEVDVAADLLMIRIENVTENGIETRDLRGSHVIVAFGGVYCEENDYRGCEMIEKGGV